MKNKKQKRSPLGEGPLRDPGQSVDQELQDLLFDGLFSPTIIALLMISFAAMEWLRFLKPIAPMPFVFTVLAALATAFAIYKVSRNWSRAKSLRLARDGERFVGQALNELRECGYKAFHDVLGDGFNVDHVLIGPGGVYTIETKTWSKPQSKSKIFFDGRGLRIDGFEPEADVVAQAKAQASWTKELLHKSTGRQFDVRPVVLFPGWYIEQSKDSTREVWVLNPKAFPKFLEKINSVLSPEDIGLASTHLELYIRAKSQTGRR